MADQQRTVTIYKMDGWDESMAEHHAATAFQNALGYLVEWNMWQNRFDTVRITCSLGRNLENPEIGALYTATKDPEARYFICAILDPQQSTEGLETGRLARFSFHS